MQKLDHKFGDDGSFWISYEDLLRKYQAFDRTRLFGPEWKVAQIWTTLDVSWTLDYHDTKFAFSLARSGPVVIVFSQLDERYFKGLEGQYRFELSFRVHDKTHGGGGEDYVVRSQNYYRMNRSVNVELDLAAGEYVVVVRIDAQRNERLMPVEEVVRAHAKDRREKLMRIGLAYDVAHSKGKIIESAEEKEAREAYELRKRARERKRMARLIREDRRDAKKAALRGRTRARKAREKAETRSKAKAERKAARREARITAEEGERKKPEAEDESNKHEAKKDGPEQGKDDKAAQVGESSAPAEGKQPEGLQTDAKTQTGDSPAQTTADEKSVKPDNVPDANNHGEGSTSSTENGENTPASSTGSVQALVEEAEPQDEEAYVTAAEDNTGSKTSEEDAKGKPEPSVEECPATPKPVQPSTTPPGRKTIPASVDVGVQTGPGLPFPPPPPPPPMRRGAPPGMYSPPPPPGAHRYCGPPRGPPMPRGELAYVPAHHLRAGHVAGIHRRAMPPPSECTVLSSSDSESELEGDRADDVSEISEQDIDECLAAERARAARAAAAAAASAAASAVGKTPPGQPGSVSVEEPLDEFEKDPWNAVGVFGLRVYYKVPDEGSGTEAAALEQDVVKLRVERPNPYTWDESSDEEAADDENEREEKKKPEKEESKVLDVDDSAKDAVGEQPPTPSPEQPGQGGDKQIRKGGGGRGEAPAAEAEDGNAVKTSSEAPGVGKIEEQPIENQPATRPGAQGEKAPEAQDTA